MSISGRLDAFELGAVGDLAEVCETRFNVGFDFATILSYPVPCCILFDIASGQLAELMDFGSKLTPSKSQSSATLWVRDTCLIVGLLPLMIVLITASLSSKM